jgi:hypothetical protein
VLDKHLKDPVSKLFQAKGMVFGFWNEKRVPALWLQVRAGHQARGSQEQEGAVAGERDPHRDVEGARGVAAGDPHARRGHTALKTGAVEGFDQSVMMTSAAGWASQIKYFTLSGHIYQPAAIAFNKAWFDKLPADLQDDLMDEGDKIVRSGREAVRKMNASLVKSFAKKGITVTTLTDEQKAAFAKATSGVKAKMAARDSGTKALIEAIDKGIKAAK